MSKKYVGYLSFLLFVMLFSCVSKEKDITIKKSPDYKKVEAAILDYVEGLYLVDSTRIEKSVDTTLRKVGYWYHPKEKKYRDNLEMTYSQLVRLSSRWNKSGKKITQNSPKKIEIFDVNTKTASAKLTAEWGIDLFHLAKVNDQWKIINVIWQSQPKAEE